jgi:hypothetical protein
MKKIFLMAVFVVAGFSTTIEPRTVEELTKESTDVVVGTAGQPHSVWNAGHTMIYTLTPIAIDHALKGSRKGTITVAQMGGTLDGIVTKVAGVQQFSAAERAALFLRPSVDMPGTFVITGLMQGRFTVAANGEVSNGVPGVHVLDRKSQTMGEFSGARMTLRQLESRVKAAVSK